MRTSSPLDLLPPRDVEIIKNVIAYSKHSCLRFGGNRAYIRYSWSGRAADAVELIEKRRGEFKADTNAIIDLIDTIYNEDDVLNLADVLGEEEIWGLKFYKTSCYTSASM